MKYIPSKLMLSAALILAMALVIEQFDTILYIPVYVILPPASYLLLNYLGDVKSPVLTASLGFLLYFGARLFHKVTGAVLPESITTASSPLFALTAAASIVFFMLLFVVFRNLNIRTLDEALSVLKLGGRGGFLPFRRAAGKAHNTLYIGLTKDEIEVMSLLIDGCTRSDILRKLHMSADEANSHERAIRKKLSGLGDSYFIVNAVANAYKLTRRETEILKCLRRNMTNTEIAAALVIAGTTVKFHVHNLLGKLDVETRYQLDALFALFEEKAGNF